MSIWNRLGPRGTRLLACLLITGAVVACGDDDDDTGQDDAPVAATPDGGAAADAGADDPTRVRIADGVLQGDMDGDSVAFLKIPTPGRPWASCAGAHPKRPSPGKASATRASSPRPARSPRHSRPRAAWTRTACI